MGWLWRLAPAFGLSSAIRFAIRESVGSVRPAPRLFSDGLRRRDSAASAIACRRGLQIHGGQSSRRFAGQSRGFARTWASRAGGSASFNSHVSIRRGDHHHPVPSGVRAGGRPIAAADGDVAHGPFGGVVGATDAAVVEGPGYGGPARRINPFVQHQAVVSRCYAVRKIAGPR